MARMSRVRGPAVAFEMVDSMTTVPGFSITRSFGRGTLDISVQFMVLNLVGSTVGPTVRLRVDGVATHVTDPSFTILNNTEFWGFLRALISVTPGIHTIDFQILGSTSAGDTVIAGRSELIVIELPDWDDDINLVIL